MNELPEGIDWNVFGWATASHYREDVLAALDTPKTPSTIADTDDLRISHVSRALGELRDRGLVELLVDEDRKKGRMYGRTETGDTLHNAIQDVTDDE